MNSFKGRIDLSAVSLDIVTEKVFVGCSEYAYVKEGVLTENPHMHFFMKTVDKIETVRQRIKRLGLSGNGGYSCKACSDEYPIELLSYMMKEGQPFFWCIPEEILEQARNRQEEFLQQKKTRKEKEPTWKEIMRSLPLELKESVYDDSFDVTLCKYIIDYYIEREMVVRRSLIMAYVDTITLHLAPSKSALLACDLMRKRY